MALVSWFRSRPGLAVRLMYFSLFAANGTFGPFMVPYLREQNLSGAQLGSMYALGPLVVLLTQPVFGWITDRLGDYRRALLILVSSAMLSNFLLSQAKGFGWIVIAFALWIMFHGPILAVIETINLVHIRSGDSYGRARMWGAIGFTVAAFAGATLMQHIPLWGIFILYPIWAIMLIVVAIFSTVGNDAQVRRRSVSVSSLLKAPGLSYLIVLVFLVNAAFAAHNTFFSIYVQELGGGPGMVGLTWAIAGLSEIPIMFLFDRALIRWGVRSLLLFGALGYTVRYALYTVVDNPYPVLLIQLLQGVTFPLFASAVVLAVGRIVPSAWRATGQMLMAAVGHSMAGIVGNPISGWVFDRWGVFVMYGLLSLVALGACLGFTRFQFKESDEPEEIRPADNAGQQSEGEMPQRPA